VVATDTQTAGHRAILTRTVAFLLACAALALLFGAKAGVAAATEPTCNSSSMYIVAHEDDTLIFQSPTLAQEIESGRCVRSVFLTAGDAGKSATYWHSRETGVEAAYALLAGVADEWQGSTVTAAGHTLLLRTLTADPGVSIVFMRLPDGGFPEGLGYAATGNQSLMKLWNGGNKASPSITSISAIDGTNSYTYNGLIETLSGLITAFEPRVIGTQDYNETFSTGDHKDHVATAYFVRQAQKSYAKPHTLLAYEGYESSSQPENVGGTLLEAKKSAFYLYGLYDEGACHEDGACSASPYPPWLRRQYVAGQETTGVVANAGNFQNVGPSTTITLNGSASSGSSGKALTYKWTQTGGPTVTLSGSTTAKPTFVSPSSKATLTFSLVVRDGVTESRADSVTVKVAVPEPPVAAPGPPQTVAAGATVTLDGSASTDPAGRNLTYAWTQTAGPTVSLSSTATAKPTFTAPAGPATLTFSLVVNNGQQNSQAATVTVTIEGAAGESNVASLATVSASSENAGESQGSAKAVDGVISGWPGNYKAEWATQGGKAGSWLQLKWAKSYTLDRVVIYDRPNENDQITSGTLTFSDGSTVAFGALPNVGAAGLALTFAPKATTSLKLTVNTVKSTTENVGLSELEVFGKVTPETPVEEQPPVASAGPAQKVASGAAVTLDGSASTDPAGHGLTYKWTQTGGAAVTLSSTTTAKPTFTAPTGPATLTFSLVVTDGSLSSKAATVTVTVEEPVVITDKNIARTATVTASSQSPSWGQTAAKAIDGVISGYPGNYEAEWVTEGGKSASWLQLKWSKSYSVDRIVLYDRPNELDQITSGTLTFSDGSLLNFGELPNTGIGYEITFAPKATTSVKLTVNSVKSTTENVGLSEIEVFGH
jgi:LmbE family N-acetylglucosaminyl deacetylase